LGAGVHTGTGFVGWLGSEQGASDITVLGDAPNTAPRLSTNAQKGEILISESAYKSSGLELDDLEKRVLKLNGKSESVNVWVMRV
jgi:class 3 adenylate cyclase